MPFLFTDGEHVHTCLQEPAPGLPAHMLLVSRSLPIAPRPVQSPADCDSAGRRGCYDSKVSAPHFISNTHRNRSTTSRAIFERT